MNEKNINGLIDKITKQFNLAKDLEQSTAIKNLWPEVFDGSTCRGFLIGKSDDIKNLKFLLKNEKEQKIFELYDIPNTILIKHFKLLFNQLISVKKMKTLAKLEKQLFNLISKRNI